jgi:hypothetical protein
MFSVSVDSKEFAWAERDTLPLGQKRDLIGPPVITKGYYIGRIIKGQEKAGVYWRSGNWGMEEQENKDIAAVIRKLDKDTLNLYTPVRMGLGTREPSEIGLVSNGLRPEHRMEGMEAGSHEQDYRN